MPLLNVAGLSKWFGNNDIFRDLTFAIQERARIGLVGPNGVGKTTLMRILLSLDEASAGEVRVTKGAQLGYLPQRPVLDSNRTVWEE